MSTTPLGWVFHLSDDKNGTARVMRKLSDGTFEVVASYNYDTPRELSLITQLLTSYLLLHKITEMSLESLLKPKDYDLTVTIDEIYQLAKDVTVL